MNRVRSVVGWMVRGGAQTRAEFAGQAEAIQALQQQVADMRSVVDAQNAAGDRLHAEVRGTLDDLARRLAAIVERLDRLEERVADHDEAVTSLTRLVAAPTDE